MLGGLQWQRKGLVACKPRRLKDRDAICQTQPCARKVGEYAISLADTMTPVWIKQQKGCGADSLVESVRSIITKKTRVRCDAGFGSPENATRSQPPVRLAPCCLSRFHLIRGTPRSLFPKRSAHAPTDYATSEAFLGFISSITSSTRHMGAASPRRNPTLTMRV